MSLHGRGRPSPGTLIALIALVFALAGTANALPGSNQIDKDDLKGGSVSGRAIQQGAVGNHKLKDGAVTDVKLADGAVINSKISDGAVGGQEIAEDSVTGTDVDESSLGEVPSAKDVSFLKPFNVRLSFGDDVELISNGPISVRARCVKNGTVVNTPNRDDAELYARTTVAGSFLNGLVNRAGDTNGDGLQDAESLDPGDTAEQSILASFGSLPTGPPDRSAMANTVDNGFVISPAGDYIGVEDGSTALGLRVLGADCVAIGTFIVQG